MKQTRYFDFAAPNSNQATARNRAQWNLAGPGVLWGLDLIVSNGELIVGAGAAMTADGVIVEFDDSQVLPFTLTSAAASYTVYLEHTYLSESASPGATIKLLRNSIIAAPILGMLPLGWVRYPGSSAALNAGHVRSAPTLRKQQGRAQAGALRSQTMHAPFVNAPGLVVAIDDEDYITLTHGWESDTGRNTTRAESSDAVNEQFFELFIPYSVEDGVRPSALTLGFRKDTEAAVLIEVRRRYYSSDTTTDSVDIDLTDVESGEYQQVGSLVPPADAPTEGVLIIRVNLPALGYFELQYLRLDFDPSQA